MNSTKGVKKSTKALIVFLICISMLFISVWSYQFSKYSGLMASYSDIQGKIDKEKKITENLEKEKTYQNSDAFIESVARQELKMIKSNEMMIVNSAK